MKKSKSRWPEQDGVAQNTAVCPTCGQPLGRESLQEIVRVPEVQDTDEPPPPPPASAPWADSPSDADVRWALSAPLTAEKREFLRAATQRVAVEQDRADSKEAELAAFEAMWPPRNPH
ncbi:MAG: hypothetical protein H0W82_06990 [Actinobacteria bacterium]|nr:hypothetical protein [Actinomycetota bacterium]